MKNYRLVEYAPENGKQYGKCIRTTVWSGPDRDELKRQIKAWHAKKPRKPYANISYYHGAKHIYAYELGEESKDPDVQNGVWLNQEEAAKYIQRTTASLRIAYKRYTAQTGKEIEKLADGNKVFVRRSDLDELISVLYPARKGTLKHGE